MDLKNHFFTACILWRVRFEKVIFDSSEWL